MEGHLLFNKAVTKQINPIPQIHANGHSEQQKAGKNGAREKADGGFVFRGTSGGNNPLERLCCKPQAHFAHLEHHSDFIYPPQTGSSL